MRHLIFYLFFGVVVFCLQSCTKYTILVDERGDNLKVYDYYVDSYGNEGIVVSQGLLETWMIVISVDEQELPWGQTGRLFCDSLSTKNIEIHNSLTMLNLMINHGIEHYPAQAWCNSKNCNDIPYTGSWRLPSYYEWKNYICNTKAQVDNINLALKSIGGTPLSLEDYYWTCTEDYENYIVISDIISDYDPDNRAIALSPMGYVLVNKERWHKKQLHKVRAIKYVYFKD